MTTISALAEAVLRHASAYAPKVERDLGPLRRTLWSVLRPRAASPAALLRGEPVATGAAVESDAELLAAAMRGDPEAFDELASRHLEALVGYGQRYLGPHEADEAVQNALVVLWQKMERVTEGSHVRPFLLRAVQFEVRKILAKRAREVPVGRAPDPEVPPDALRSLLVGEEVARVSACLDAELDPLEQYVVLRSVVDGQRAREIGDALALTEGNVRVIKHRALRRLRRRLEEPGS